MCSAIEGNKKVAIINYVLGNVSLGNFVILQSIIEYVYTNQINTAYFMLVLHVAMPFLMYGGILTILYNHIFC